MQTLAASAEYVPALHWVQSVDPCSEYLPASQLVQSAAPATALYLPASHISHVKVPV